MSNGQYHGAALHGTASTEGLRRGYGPDPSCQPCPDCGGLECLCRPRFFAGQLLTEQDLNRLDHYIVEKHKLHNRHLWGWGVVCGLEALCDQCGDQVRVTPGYALSPCGEDIVVCKPDLVDVCALIEHCRKSDEQDCRPYAGQDGCEGVEEDWVLAIRYIERPSRGTTPLIGASSCSCAPPAAKSCGCGGGASCGCGCGSASGGAAAQPSQDMPKLRRGAAPTCEPTLTCESYRYEVFRMPEKDPAGKDKSAGSLTGSFAGIFEKLDGELAERISCCLRDLEAAMPAAPSDLAAMTDQDRQAWYRWACASKRALAQYFARIGGGKCDIVEQLAGIAIPPPSLPLAQFKTELEQALVPMILVAFDAILHCICSNLLPPCAGPDDPRVPLAVVTVRRSGCDVIKVCNWTPLRRHVTTFRALDYWFGWLPLRKLVRDGIEEICCNALGLFDRFKPGDVKEGPPAPPPPASIATAMATGPSAQPAEVSLDTPLAFTLGKPFSIPSTLTRAAAASLGNESVTLNDLMDLAYRRRSFPIGEAADAEADQRNVAALAASGPMRVLAGLARGAGLAEPALSLVARKSDSERIASLAARLDAQEREIAELRASVPAAKPRRARRAKK